MGSESERKKWIECKKKNEQREREREEEAKRGVGSLEQEMWPAQNRRRRTKREKLLYLLLKLI